MKGIRLVTVLGFFAVCSLAPAVAHALAGGVELLYNSPSPSPNCRIVVKGDNPWDLVRRMSGIRDRGIIARAVPEMNIFIIGFAVRLIMGMIILWVSIDMFTYIFHAHLSQTFAELTSLIKVMN